MEALPFFSAVLEAGLREVATKALSVFTFALYHEEASLRQASIERSLSLGT